MPHSDLDKYTQQMFVKYFPEAAFPLFALGPFRSLRNTAHGSHRRCIYAHHHDHQITRSPACLIACMGRFEDIIQQA